MKRHILVLMSVFLVFVLAASAVFASISSPPSDLLTVQHIEISGNDATITTDFRRGVDTGARAGNAPFELDIVLHFPELPPATLNIPLGQTNIIESNGKTTRVEATITSSEPFLQTPSEIDVTARIVSKTPRKTITLAETQAICSNPVCSASRCSFECATTPPVIRE